VRARGFVLVGRQQSCALDNNNSFGSEITSKSPHRRDACWRSREKRSTSGPTRPVDRVVLSL